jgi:hypothetical protein
LIKKNIPHTFHLMLGTKCGSAGEFDELRAAALRFLIIPETLASADFTSNQQRHSLKNARSRLPAAEMRNLGKDARMRPPCFSTAVSACYAAAA